MKEEKKNRQILSIIIYQDLATTFFDLQEQLTVENVFSK